MSTYRPDSKTLLKTDSILEYVLDTTVYPREHERMRELRLITQEHPRSFFASSPDQMQFFSVLLKMIGAKNTIEVGVFTGYSLLATALALPADGKVVAIDVNHERLLRLVRVGGVIAYDNTLWGGSVAMPRDTPSSSEYDRVVVAIDVNREYYELGRPVIEKAGVAHKVDFREGDGLTVMDRMLAEDGAGAVAGTFDFAYADAKKEEYCGYHERLLRLVRVGGVIAYDNTLWGGSVAMPRDTPSTSEYHRVVRGYIIQFNAMVAADDRVEACLLPFADGVTLCRRLK